MSKTHLVMYSGGAGSWNAANRVVESFGVEQTKLLFTDTTMEDNDLYRFLIEGACDIYNIKAPDFTLSPIPDLDDKETNYIKIANKYLDYLAERRKEIECYRSWVLKNITNFIWIKSDDDPWTIFFSQKMMGNSRIDLCSRILKREPAKDYVLKNYTPENVVIYIGHGWDEQHRTEKAKRNWSPFQLEAPNSQKPFLMSSEIKDIMRTKGIRQPVLYDEGFPHNNCSGFCVRAGQAHFKNLYEKRPVLYKYMEALEQKFRHEIGKDVSILKDRRNNQLRPMTLLQWRARIEGNDFTDEEAIDWGGCGCFSDEQEPDLKFNLL